MGPLFTESDRYLVGSVALHQTDTLQSQREKLARIVLDSMYQFVGLLDAQGRTLEINRSALEGAGVDLADIRGKPFWEARWFQVSRETTELQRDFVRRAQGGEFIRCDMEIYGQAAGDETIVVDFSLLPVRDARGKVAFLLAEGRNITAKKRAEEEIARKNAELETLLTRIRQLDQQKSDFFANVSHELRTPLALILGPAEELLASGSQLSDPQRHQLGVIQRNATALLKHVNDLLDLSKLDAERMGLHYTPFDLAALVREHAEQFHAVAPQLDLRYVVSTPDTLSATLDQDKTERILQNLLSNAFKFTPPGGRVRCALERSGPDRCLISVQDSGPGVPPDMQQRIFERFRQGQTGTTRNFGGTGLGLAIAKEFTELMHGSIAVTAAAGGGSLFQVELPLAPPPEAAALHGVSPARARPAPAPNPALAELTPPDEAPQRGEAAAGAPRILVVEDNPEMRRFICDALSDEFQVASAPDGQAALEAALASPPDLLVTDLMLPRLGGDGLVDALHAVPGLQDLPVLVLSARDDAALRARLLASAAQDYVTKPFSAQELRARVRNLATMKLARDGLQRELLSQSNDLAGLTRSLIENRRALQASEQRWWAIYEHAPVGIALIGADGGFKAANPAFRSMVDYTEGELLAIHLPRLTPVEDRAATQRRLERLLAGEVDAYHVQRRFQRQDGALVWAITSVSLVPGTPGGEQLLVLVAADITEQRHAEQSLARARTELAQVARVSTLGELTASIAHEVNQPLAAIVANGHASLRWLDGSPPNEPEAKAAVGRIIRDANRAGEVITRIRRFVQRHETRHAALAIHDAIRDVMELVRSEAQARCIEIVHLDADPVPEVLADRIQLQQVILNLVMNGLEAMAGGGHPATLQISAHRQADAVQVDVTDSGTGIAPAIQDTLLDAFQTTKPDGMGMGLAISRSIVESHGGSLWFTPNAGPGVTFSFSLPLAVQDAPP
ncbi:MAG: histidine kinase [Betaproteobacteria bacterium HGW-Betaproteobacteria-9]|nr:MAG: histidine kinase [Betaproteobacteria bacterium HGW-Betaproteobacteria-9]